jgi:hypothetical protein
MLKELPICRKPITETFRVEPMAARPCTEAPEPTRANCRILKLLPSVNMSTMDVLAWNRTKDRTEQALAK